MKILLYTLLLSLFSFAGEWHIDKAHSEIGFGVKHMLVSTTKGKFKAFDGAIHLDPQDLSKTTISFSQ